VNWFLLGCREFRQKGRRLYWWVAIRFDERRLLKAEITLGELGWQQADFPEHVEATIDNLRRIEKEQADLFNRGADLSGELAAAQKDRDQHNAEYRAARTAVLQETQPHIAGREQEEAARAELQKLTAALREQLPDLQEQEREYRRQIGEVTNQPLSTPQLSEEKRRLNDLHQATLGSISAAHDGIEKTCAKIRVHDELIAKLDPVIEALQQKLEALDTAFNEADRVRAARVLKLQQDKHGVERRLTELDQAKGNEFLIVGRCLADAQIPPMNQPQALQKVLALRGAIATRKELRTASLAWSDAQDFNELKKFYFTVGLAIGVVILVICVSLRATGH
jgi:DNA repair exonuclease SbcCD ATPase subunit